MGSRIWGRQGIAGIITTFVVLAVALTCAAAPSREFSYGPSPSQTLNVCLPSDGLQARPGVLIIHGGGWTAGDKVNARGKCITFSRHGIVAVAIDYRLANAADPSTRWPAQLEDAQAALSWMIGHSVELGLDPQRICVYGESAGGQIALWLAIEDKRPACVVDAFGPVDLTTVDKRLFKGSMTALFGNAQDMSFQRAASPIFHIPPGLPPTMILQGDRDQLVSPKQSQALFNTLKSQKDPATFILYPGGHSFSGLTPSSYDRLFDRVIGFIENVSPRRD